ncbi:MAG: PQQ-binding-like beta-propeller repeat protein, partial [bacterium]
TCDGGWPAGQDCPQLLCYDANNGKELWRRDLDHFDNLPEAEAKAAKADRAEAWKQTHEYCALFWELRHGNPDAARQTTIIERFKKAGFEVREPALEWFRDKLGSNSGILCDKALSSRLAKVGFECPTWGWRCMGVAMPTPASDGKAVYVATGFRTMSAFDLDGKKLWQQVITQSIPGEGAFFTEEFAHSPFLIEGKLLMHWFNHLWCYEPASGKLLWSTKTKPIPAHAMGQPTVLRLDAGGKPVTCIFTTWGQLIRLSDGKLLLDKIAWFGCNAVMSGDGKDVVWGKNGAEAGGPKEERLHYDKQSWKRGMVGIRFRLDASGETATSERVALPCADAEMGWSVYPMFSQGRIICNNGEIVSWDGKEARLLRPGIRHIRLGSNGSILADNRLYGLQEDCSGKGGGQMVRNCFIRWMWIQDDRPVTSYDNPVELLPAPLDMPPEQQRKIMAQIGSASAGAHGGIYGWHNSYKTPSAAGDRLYVRTFDN